MMKTEDIIKYALIAAAAYMVYRYLKESGALDKLLGTSAETQIPATAEPAVVTAAVQPAATTTAPTISSSDLRARWKAMMDVDTTGGFAADGVTRTHNFYHYQHYYQQLAGRDLPPSETLGLDEAGRLRDMTFDEFWNLLVAAKSAGQTAGYPGLSALQMLRALSAWTGNGGLVQ